MDLNETGKGPDYPLNVVNINTSPLPRGPLSILKKLLSRIRYTSLLVALLKPTLVRRGMSGAIGVKSNVTKRDGGNLGQPH